MRQKLTREPIKMPRFHGISMAKLGSIALNFGHMIRLASSTFCPKTFYQATWAEHGAFRAQ